MIWWAIFLTTGWYVMAGFFMNNGCNPQQQSAKWDSNHGLSIFTVGFVFSGVGIYLPILSTIRIFCIRTQILHDFTWFDVVKYQNHDHPMAWRCGGMRPIGLQIRSFPVHPVSEWFFLADSELGVQYSDSILLGMALFGSTWGNRSPVIFNHPKLVLFSCFWIIHSELIGIRSRNLQ